MPSLSYNHYTTRVYILSEKSNKAPSLLTGSVSDVEFDKKSSLKYITTGKM